MNKYELVEKLKSIYVAVWYDDDDDTREWLIIYLKDAQAQVARLIREIKEEDENLEPATDAGDIDKAITLVQKSIIYMCEEPLPDMPAIVRAIETLISALRITT